MFDREKFKEKINALCAGLQYPARKMNITGSQLYAYRSGRSCPSAEAVRRICKACDMPADDLLGVTEKCLTTRARNICDHHFDGSGKFWIRFRAAMMAQGVTQQLVADSLGMSTQTISNYANGLTEPNGAVIVALCEYLKVSADWLLGLA